MRLIDNPYIIEDIETVSSCNIIDWERFRGKTIAVTGATGLIGKLMVLSLIRANKLYDLDLKVLAFIRNREKARVIFDGEDNSCVRFVVQDIALDPDRSLRADFLIHTAAITSSKKMIEKPVETISTSIGGTENMMSFAARCRAESAVYLSSMEVYGTIPEGAGEIRENDLGFIDPLSIRSCYSEGKRMCECICASYASEYGVPVKIARLAATSGPEIDPSDTRVIGQFARSVIYKKHIVLHTKGDKANCYLYTADAITGILFLLLRGAQGEAYNICNPSAFCSIRDLAKTFASLDTSGKVKVVFDIPDDVAQMGYAPASVMKLNADKFIALGWSPSVDLGEMARRITNSIDIQL